MNIFVDNLPLEVTEKDVREAFEAFVVVESVIIIKNKHTGQSRRFGFVEIAARVKAQRAINELNGMEMKGRTLKVKQVP